ncbi:NACHT domain-containing protein [Dendronalium sp. ChiSLP03b]|uniref:NACHT domain-containing protein n=1 Tax=Dendronalium sp. ChiSLP03b TaxID=3075381 RepID=UPI002AD3EE7F|nr:NACHT domain-containing protein [Dendronalium sp. ChiSLP03b]MDZ8203269.1 NACHT domain-containing protein [Dendronalium sp. ChiSLP03b]
MAAIQVDQDIFLLLRQAYSEKFGGSPSSLINRLNHLFREELVVEGENLIADRTIRAFFNSSVPPKMQEKNLNYLCSVLLDQKSYREALRQLINIKSDLEGDWLDPYWKHLDRKCRTMRVLDMNEPILIDSIYVRFNILKNIQGRRQQTIQYLLNNSEKESSNKTVKRLPFSGNEEHVPALEAAIQHRKLMILGKPGAGKTTFLKYLAIHFPAAESKENIIPVFIALRDISNNERKISLGDAVIQEFTNYIPNSENTVKKLLERGQCLILLDGLDEIKAENNNICRQIDEFTEQFPDNRFIITCRSAACDYVFNTFTEVEIADFEHEEIEAFARNWFQARGEQNICGRFLEKLEENQQIKELATNPLLLTILCLTFEDNYDFSSNRYGLYRDAVDTLLRRWDASRRIERQPNFHLSWQRKINMFSEIAYEGLSHKPSKFLWQQWELQDQIAKFLKNISFEIVDTQEILKLIEANYGLLIQQFKGIYSFSHLTFQEYFAAEYIVENRQPEFFKAFVEQNLLERQWREVFILITERLRNADEFLKLIFRCINDIVKNSQELQSMLNWLHKMTTDANISSSGWRAYYLAIDLDVELYISQAIQIERPLFGKLATELRNYNKKHKKLTLPQPKSLLISRLVAIHAIAIDRASGKHFQKTDFTRKVFEFSNDSDIDIKKKLSFAIEKAEEAKLTDLVGELKNLQGRYPASDASKPEWKTWAEDLRQLMVDHLDVGHSVDLSKDAVKALEEYIYANYLLLECISGENNSSRSLRDAIIDNLLLPQDEIPTDLLSI